MTKAATHNRIAVVRDIPMTVLRSGHQVTKRFELDGDGTLLRSPAVPIGKAAVETWQVPSAISLAECLLKEMNPNEVFMLGHFPSNAEYIVPKGVSLSTNQVHRTKECASWANGPQWMVLDVDRSHCKVPFETPEALHATLVELAPCLDGVEMLIISSGSSGIYRTSDGAQLSPYGGWHVWLRLARGTDWEDFLDWLVGRCWLFGQFRHVVSGSGSLLERGLVDASVASPERVQYSSPSTLGAGLAQQRKFEVFGEEGRELSGWQKLSADQKKEVTKRKELSRHAMLGAAEETREKWLLARKASLMARGVDEVGAVQRALAAVDGHLDDQWELILESGKAITVGELLADRASYDGVRCLDPLEPEYQGHAAVGRVFWRENGKKPILHSFAHGGANYTLGGKVDTLSALVSDLVYVVSDKSFVSLSKPGKAYTRDSLNFAYGHELENVYKLLMEHQDKRVVDRRIWWPGKPQIFELGGVDCLNTCKDLSAPRVAHPDEDIALWLDHMDFIYGSTKTWILDHMSYMVQHPEVKQNSHPIVGGAHGIGKDLTVWPLREWYGKLGALGALAALPEVLDYHDQLVEARFVVVSECSITDLGLTERRRLSTQLKAFTVSNGPDEVLSLNVKRKDRVEQANLMSWWMFTNSITPLELEHGDRRFMFHWCRELPRSEEYYTTLVDWLELNWMLVIEWLAARDTTGYNPKAPAPMTKEKLDLIDQRSWDDDGVIGNILDAWGGVGGGVGGVDGGAIAVSVQKLFSVARALGMDFKSEESGRKVIGAKLRSFALRAGLAVDRVKGQPGGRGTPTIERTAAVLDPTAWEKLGSSNEKLRYLLDLEKENMRY